MTFLSPSIQKRAVPNAPTGADPSLQLARDAVNNTAATSYGRAQTILTQPGQPQAPAQLAKKTLLGG